jgi:hypothetical protein
MVETSWPAIRDSASRQVRSVRVHLTAFLSPKVSVLICCLCVLLAMWAQAQPQINNGIATDSAPAAPTITVSKPDIDGKTLKMRYQIENNSGQDIWICEDISLTVHDYDFEAYMAEDRQTLLIRRRLDIESPGSAPPPPKGRYVRLRKGQTRTESLVLSLPVESRFFWGFPTSEGKAYAKSLALEIGYHPGDMPSTIRRILAEPKELRSRTPVLYGINPVTDVR